MKNKLFYIGLALLISLGTVGCEKNVGWKVWETYDLIALTNTVDSTTSGSVGGAFLFGSGVVSGSVDGKVDRRFIFMAKNRETQDIKVFDITATKEQIGFSSRETIIRFTDKPPYMEEHRICYTKHNKPNMLYAKTADGFDVKYYLYLNEDSITKYIQVSIENFK